MLDRLLELLQQGGTHQIRALGDELGTTPELVRAMLEDLERMGYVRRLGAECAARCSTCSLSGACVARDVSREGSGAQGITGWALVDGRRAL